MTVDDQNNNHTPAPRTHRLWKVGAIGAGAAVVAAIGIAVVAGSAGTDRSDPTATGQAFVHAIATGHGDACQLATPTLATQLRTNGRCANTTSTDARVQLLFSQPCATRGLLGAQITPPLAPGKPYVLVGLARNESGEWAATSLRPLADRAAVRGGICDTHTDGGD